MNKGMKTEDLWHFWELFFFVTCWSVQIVFVGTYTTFLFRCIQTRKWLQFRSWTWNISKHFQALIHSCANFILCTNIYLLQINSIFVQQTFTFYYISRTCWIFILIFFHVHDDDTKNIPARALLKYSRKWQQYNLYWNEFVIYFTFIVIYL